MFLTSQIANSCSYSSKYSIMTLQKIKPEENTDVVETLVLECYVKKVLDLRLAA